MGVRLSVKTVNQQYQGLSAPAAFSKLGQFCSFHFTSFQLAIDSDWIQVVEL